MYIYILIYKYYMYKYINVFMRAHTQILYTLTCMRGMLRAQVYRLIIYTMYRPKLHTYLNKNADNEAFAREKS